MRRPPIRLALPALACAAVTLVAVAACLSPTEIVLDVRTNVPCTGTAAWRGVAISVGEPGLDVESRAPVLTTTACDASGNIGSLVVVPTGSRNAEVGIRVVAGITSDPETCPSNGYDGCIVSRRTVAYLPHQSQQVLVDLTANCIGNACDLNHTCVSGSCTDTVTATAPVSPDGGVLTGPVVRCGDDGTQCAANDPSLVCCVAFVYDGGTSKGTCVAPHDCPSTSATIACDDTSDCPVGDASDAIVCCQINTANGNLGPTVNASCLGIAECQGTSARVLCQDRQPCPLNGGACGVSGSAPGYYDCSPLTQ